MSDPSETMAAIDVALAPLARMAGDAGPVNASQLLTVSAAVRAAFNALVYGVPEAAPAVQPEPEAAPAVQPEPEAAPAVQPEPEAAPAVQPEPEEITEETVPEADPASIFDK